MRRVLFSFLLCFLFVFVIASVLPAKPQDTPKEGILLAAFGTSVPEAAEAFRKIESCYHKEFPGVPVVWAYTSQIIRKKLARENIKIGGIASGLDELARQGVRVVRAQSLHVMAGEEFVALARAILVYLQKHPETFSAVYLGRPLLESEADARAASKAVREHMAGKRAEGEAVVLMGHGQEHGRADLVFEGARSIFRNDDSMIFMATVEGSRSFDDMLDELKKHDVKKIWLAPFMVVAGEHARNDLAGGEEDSWASRLRAQGYEVEVCLHGLGELPGIGELFARHTRQGSDDLTKEPKKQ